VWAARGDPARARGFYEQALAKKPDNAGLREKMGKLAR
jgi:hypothetical protein